MSDLVSSGSRSDPPSLAEGIFAIAHDMNNALTVICGNLSLAERHAAGNPKLVRLLNNVQVAIDRATELTVRLAALSRSRESEPESLSEGASRPAGASLLRILVVEDDPDVGEVAVAVLENLGYLIELRVDAASALALLQQGTRFDLVFSDIMMPGPMNGIDLAEAIAREFPGLPVLLATGYSNAALAPGALHFPVLAKPYSVQDLARRIRQTMEAGG